MCLYERKNGVTSEFGFQAGIRRACFTPERLEAFQAGVSGAFPFSRVSRLNASRLFRRAYRFSGVPLFHGIESSTAGVPLFRRSGVPLFHGGGSMMVGNTGSGACSPFQAFRRAYRFSGVPLFHGIESRRAKARVKHGGRVLLFRRSCDFRFSPIREK